MFFDEEFAFHDGETGEKLFVVLGTIDKVSVVAKTTSQQHGRGTVFGCQPTDRFHNFFIPPKANYFNKCTWICLNEFYELDPLRMLKKRYDGKINPVCTLQDHILKLVQECAIISLDISKIQAEIIKACIS